ncbi:MAG: hypothetical protein ACO1TE_20980 [Prosthecobacter sp.]
MHIISFLRTFRATRVIKGKLTLPSSSGLKMHFAFGQRDVEFSQGQQVVVASARQGMLVVANRPELGDVVLDCAEEGVDFEVLRTAVLAS